jgi:hypothetical protein
MKFLENSRTPLEKKNIISFTIMYKYKNIKYNVGGRIFVTYSTAIDYARLKGLEVTPIN